jgi:hypothetical protein
LVFSTLYETLAANPATVDFRFSVDGVEKLLLDCCNLTDFGDGNLVLKLARDIRDSVAGFGENNQSAAEEVAL